MQNRSLAFYLVMAFILIALGVFLFFSSKFISNTIKNRKAAEPKTLERIIAEDLTAPKYQPIGIASEKTLESLTAPSK